MTDGERLKYFIDNQSKSKIAIANDLGVSKQTLYQYFRSKQLSDDIKERFEIYFGKEIFTKEAIEEIGKLNFYKIADAQSRYVALGSNDALIASLNKQIDLLESHCAFIQKAYEDRLANMERLLKEAHANSDSALKNQVVIMKQIQVAVHVGAERFAGNDKQKFLNEIDKIDKLLDLAIKNS
jgi:AcrR family transcriptional regulator